MEKKHEDEAENDLNGLLIRASDGDQSAAALFMQSVPKRCDESWLTMRGLPSEPSVVAICVVLNWMTG